MVKLVRIPKTHDDNQRQIELRNARVWIANEMVARSEVDHTQTIMISISTKKIRDRSKDATVDRYIVSGIISVV